MKITNKYTATVILPPNEAVHRGQSINYPNWDAIKDMPNIAWYVDNSFFMVEESEESGMTLPDRQLVAVGSFNDELEVEEDYEEDAESEPDEKTKLISDLAELGVEVDGRTGLKKLRAMLDEKLAEQQ